jgi:hypothetical protein
MAVFLSYSRRDEDVVKALARGFDAAKCDIWFDHDLTGGEVWWDTILGNIRSSAVFLLAVSDHSLSSRACMAELEYAQKLGRPILPVEVGRVTTTRSNSVAGLQAVFFRADDAVSGFEVLAAADDAARRVGPLPDPLPPEPPIPFAYLQVIRRSFDQGELPHSQQLDAIGQLRRALSDETDASVRAEIVAILEALDDKPWLSRGATLEVRAVLHAHRALEAELAGDVPPDPGDPPVAVTDPADDVGDQGWPPRNRLDDEAPTGQRELDPATAFLTRIDEIHRQMQGGRFWQQGSAAQSEPPPLPPSYFAGVESAKPSPGHTEASRTKPVASETAAVVPVSAPPSRWPLSIAALLVWALSEAVVAVRLGVIALVLLVPGAFAVVAAISSHRLGGFAGAGKTEQARRASRIAQWCGAVGLVGLILTVIAIFAAAGNLNTV